MDSDVAVRTDGLTKYYGRVRALVDVDLVVPRGTIFGLLGPNGAGKTTALRILTGLARPTRGRAWVLGLDPADPNSRRPGCVGALVEQPAFYAYLSGRENLRMLAYLSGLNPSLKSCEIRN